MKSFLLFLLALAPIIYFFFDLPDSIIDPVAWAAPFLLVAFVLYLLFKGVFHVLARRLSNRMSRFFTSVRRKYRRLKQHL